MSAPTVEDQVAERIGVARDLVEEIASEIRAYDEQTSPPTWAESGTLGAAIQDLRSALIHLQGVTHG